MGTFTQRGSSYSSPHHETRPLHSSKPFSSAPFIAHLFACSSSLLAFWHCPPSPLTSRCQRMAGLIRLLADVFDEQLFKPIDRIENERLEVVCLVGERRDSRDDIGRGLRRGEARHVEVMSAALGIEEHGRRELRRKGGLTDAFGTEDDGFLWPGDAPGEDATLGHDGLRFVPRESAVPPASNGAALPKAKTSGVSRFARLP